MTRLRDSCKLEVLYDGACPICMQSMHWLQKMDALNLLQFRSFRDIPEAQLPIPLTQLEQRIHSRAFYSTTYKNGIHAICQICARTVITLPLYPLVWMSAQVGLGQTIYDFVARRRFTIGSTHCSTGTCGLPAPSRQTNDEIQ